MRTGIYRFHCTLNQDAVLPPYKGSTFRGGFGVALKRTVCALKRQECPSCLLRESCLYHRVFEPKPSQLPRQRLAAAPHPYVIRPPLDTQRHYPEGASFDFELLLFGDLNQSLPFFVYTLEQMGEKGIGKGRATFTLNQVTAGNRIIYRQQDKKIDLHETTCELNLAAARPGHHQVRLVLLTPLRLKKHGHLTQKLDFETLVRACLRRISGLTTHYGDGEPELDYPQLVADAAAITASADKLRWHEWQRYSNRQQESMQFGGLLGEITFDRVPGRYVPLLEFAQQVSLGKQTSFGLGQFELELR